MVSCKKNKGNAVFVEASATLYCYVPSDSLKGKQYLQNKFLKQIDDIQPNASLLMDTFGMVLINGGTYNMGGDVPKKPNLLPSTALSQADEFPKHEVTVSDFYMDEHEVTVAQFMAFVKATGYKTVAEYDIDWEDLKQQVPEGTPKPNEESLKAGGLLFQYPSKDTATDDLLNWWIFQKGVNWMNPNGNENDLIELMNLPVTQVSWYDAMAYAKWMNKRLPTEAEYEYAMRGGVENTLYPWGNDVLDDTANRGNFLQGNFPYVNTSLDGYEFTAPVKSFPPNAFGLYDIVGNVWEWTLDWYGADYYYKQRSSFDVSVNPIGPEQTVEVHNNRATSKVVRGGSFLCNDSWCSGFRNARRMRLSPDSGMQHVGFRCVRDVK